MSKRYDGHVRFWYEHGRLVALTERDYPPQHNYRQTKRGRVPRLTPAMRAKKRELRERSGR